MTKINEEHYYRVLRKNSSVYDRVGVMKRKIGPLIYLSFFNGPEYLSFFESQVGRISREQYILELLEQ